jgi:hypothetical protein
MLKNVCAIAMTMALFAMPGVARPAAVAGEPAAETILLPAGTQVPVHLVGSISSGSAKAGDTFQIQAAQNVVINGMIVIRNGAGGEGRVTEVDAAGGNGHSGALGVTFEYIYSADGGRIRLLDAPQKQAEEDRKGASSTATIIGFATFGVGGLFGHNFAHGRDKKLDETTVIDAFVADTVHVRTSERTVDAQYDK